MYSENDLVRIAKRDGNKKRNYLVVDPLQGKHVPVSPTKALGLFDALAEKVKTAYPEERLLVIGFAETATAIGAEVAVYLGADYIQTTREQIAGVHYLFFSEEHSHATEQKLIREDMDEALEKTERIVFVEDEVTTGKTILNIINILEKQYPGKCVFSVASLLNGMTKEHLEEYQNRNINLHWLVKTDHSQFAKIADTYQGKGVYHSCDLRETELPEEIQIKGLMNTRRLCNAIAYKKACEELWKNISARIKTEDQKHILVIGTEECMYPALFVGRKLEEEGCLVKSHSTTRSPICVGNEEDYPLQERFELRSIYDGNRVTYLYDIQAYNMVLIVTDAECEKEEKRPGMTSLVNALKIQNKNIEVIRWC
ncbi:MAG: hypothetical protein E7294_10600 [Lachnospiraceae bacterium]|nr:hypothetical protein [Lachnospiraceae bacterium]